MLESFIAQFYDDKPLPKLILASHDFETRALMDEALSSKAGYKVEIRVPQRGAKSDLIDHAVQNAREALGRRLAETSSQTRLLEGVKERFDLAATPRRIEVYDNSHIQGAHAVGGMIVAGPEGFVKGQYRKFNIKSEGITPGDDYGMMREVLTRRFKRLAADDAKAETGEGAEAEAEAAVPAAEISRIEQPAPPPLKERGADGNAFGVLRADQTGPPANAADDDDGTGEPALIDEPFPDRPDLVLIDGGLGQLAVAREVLAELGISDIALVGVAKGPDRDAGREHFHLPGRAASIMLEPRDPVLYFVQRLRDEAHRFAIGTHRAKRSKAIGINPLDEIDGIGPTRKRALLQHFGSAKAVSRAGVEDLKAVKGVSAEMAQKIYDFFHDQKN